jgi:hypothetical protein
MLSFVGENVSVIYNRYIIRKNIILGVAIN